MSLFLLLMWHNIVKQPNYNLIIVGYSKVKIQTQIMFFYLLEIIIFFIIKTEKIT